MNEPRRPTEPGPPPPSGLADLVAAVCRFRDARDWAQFHTPKNLAMAIGVESAELSELFLWKDDAEVAEALARPDFREKVSHEMADVLVL